MKKYVFLWVLYVLSLAYATAQTTHSSYRMDLMPYLGYYNVTSKGSYTSSASPSYMLTYPIEDKKVSGFMASFKANGSLLGLLYNKESKFYLADYLGFELGVGTLNTKKSSTQNTTKEGSFGIILGVDLGLALGYAISDNIEVGTKLMLLRGTYATDLKNSVGYEQMLSLMPSVRVSNLMLTVGFGQGAVNGTGFKVEDGKSFMTEVRFLASKSNYICLKYENSKGERDASSSVLRKESASQISIGFGILPSSN
jgi:hypothetical protein